MAQTQQVARKAVLIAAVEAVSEELYKNVTSVFKTILHACYATEDDLGRAVQESILDQLFCESCESYALLAIGNRRAIRGDLLQWVTDRIGSDSDAILGRHFGFNTKGYYVTDVDNPSSNSWRAFDHIKIAGLFNFNRALNPFRQKASDAISAGLNRAAILIALGAQGSLAQAIGNRRENKLDIEASALTGAPTKPAHPVLSDWIVNRTLQDLERKYLSDQEKKPAESSSIGHPRCAAISYRVERLKRYAEEMECAYEAEIETGRLADTAGLWAAVYAQKILPSVSSKINSLVWDLSHRVWLTGGDRPAEKATVEEAQRELSRLKAGLERKLASACEHTAAAGGVPRS